MKTEIEVTIACDVCGKKFTEKIEGIMMASENQPSLSDYVIALRQAKLDLRVVFFRFDCNRFHSDQIIKEAIVCSSECFEKWWNQQLSLFKSRAWVQE